VPDKVFIRPQAREDILDHLNYIAEHNPNAAFSFIDAVQNAFQALADMPAMGAPRDLNAPLLVGLRMWPVHAFDKHLIFYRPIEPALRRFASCTPPRIVCASWRKVPDGTRRDFGEKTCYTPRGWRCLGLAGRGNRAAWVEIESKD